MTDVSYRGYRFSPVIIGNDLLTIGHHPFRWVEIGMRIAFLASAVVVLIGGSATYALVGKSTPSQKAEVKTTAVEAPRLETARLFSAPLNVPPAHASDLIAAKLAPQPTPVAWPEVQKPKAAKRVASKPGSKADPGAQTTKKPKPQQTPKPNTQARKTQASP